MEAEGSRRRGATVLWRTGGRSQDRAGEGEAGGWACQGWSGGAQGRSMHSVLGAARWVRIFSMSAGISMHGAAPTAEVVAIARRVAALGGMHSTHMRDEEAGVLDSIRESMRIGREAGLPVVISHHKCAARENWGRTRETLALIAEAQKTQDLDLDVYPYVAGSTVLLMEIVERSERVIVSWTESHPEVAGRTLDEIAREWGCELADAVDRLEPADGIYFMMDEEDLAPILAFPGAMIGSDGLPHDVFPHPRLWVTFPRVLGRYVRDEGLLGLKDAVHQNERQAGRGVRPPRARRGARGGVRGPRALRPRRDRRHCDLREPDASRGRDPFGHRQRPRGVVGRRRRLLCPGPRPPPPPSGRRRAYG